RPDLAGDVARVPPRRLHPPSPLVHGLFFVVRAWPVAPPFTAGGRALPPAVIAVPPGLWQRLAWLPWTHGTGSDGLPALSRSLRRNIQVVPPQRVQQVEVRRQLRHRVTGLAVVRIGLAGGGAGAQVDLDALSEREAAELATTLERWRARHRNTTD